MIALTPALALHLAFAGRNHTLQTICLMHLLGTTTEDSEDTNVPLFLAASRGYAGSAPVEIYAYMSPGVLWQKSGQCIKLVDMVQLLLYNSLAA